MVNEITKIKVSCLNIYKIRGLFLAKNAKIILKERLLSLIGHKIGNSEHFRHMTFYILLSMSPLIQEKHCKLIIKRLSKLSLCHSPFILL